MEPSKCAIHDTVEQVTKESYLVCFECGHVFQTEQELIDEDLAFRELIYKDEDREIEPAKSGDEIWICPLCNHDF